MMQTLTPMSIHEFPIDIKNANIPLIWKVVEKMKGIAKLDKAKAMTTSWWSLKIFSAFLMRSEPRINPIALHKNRKEY